MLVSSLFLRPNINQQNFMLLSFPFLSFFCEYTKSTELTCRLSLFFFFFMRLLVNLIISIKLYINLNINNSNLDINREYCTIAIFYHVNYYSPQYYLFTSFMLFNRELSVRIHKYKNTNSGVAEKGTVVVHFEYELEGISYLIIA